MTVFADVDASARDQLRCVAVQAALLAAGSLDPDVVRGLARRRRSPAGIWRWRGTARWPRRRPCCRRQCAPSSTATVAARSESPAASLAIAMGREAVADPPASLRHDPPAARPGTRRAARRRASGPAARPATARRGSCSASSTTAKTTTAPSPDLVSSPIGGGGLIGAAAQEAARRRTLGVGAARPVPTRRHAGHGARRASRGPLR